MSEKMQQVQLNKSFLVTHKLFMFSMQIKLPVSSRAFQIGIRQSSSREPRGGSMVAAWVHIIYGCNEQWAFCILPAAGGVKQLRPLENIVQEVQTLVQQGYKEVTLLGQNFE
jgi:tRNA A37 methylthiotransferase MiaB